MKYNDIVAMYNNGIMGASSRSLNLASAYALTKFKSEINRLFEEWKDKFNALPKEVEIEDAETFSTRLNELKAMPERSKEEEKDFKAMEEKMNRLAGLQNKLAEDDVYLKVKPMSWEQWNVLKESNRNIKVGNFELFELTETSLEGILFDMPEEEEENN